MKIHDGIFFFKQENKKDSKSEIGNNGRWEIQERISGEKKRREGRERKEEGRKGRKEWGRAERRKGEKLKRKLLLNFS